MAFPTVANTNTTNGTGATANAAVNLPASIKAGQLLIVLHRCSAAGAHGYPAGWNELFDDASDGSTNQTSCAWRKADGSEGATITVTQTSSKFASLAYAIDGAESPTVQPPEFATLVTGSSTIPDPGTVTPTGGSKDYLFLWMGGWEGEQTSPPASQPTNYTNPIGADSGTAGVVTTNCRVASARRTNTATSENPGTWTISVTDDWTATVIAVHPSDVRTLGTRVTIPVTARTGPERPLEPGGMTPACYKAPDTLV